MYIKKFNIKILYKNQGGKKMNKKTRITATVLAALCLVSRQKGNVNVPLHVTNGI